MIVLVALTAMAQIMVTRSFGRMYQVCLSAKNKFLTDLLSAITEFLPMSLATKKMAKRYEKHQQKYGGPPVTPDEELDLDIFKRNGVFLCEIRSPFSF